LNIFELLMFSSIAAAGYICGKWLSIYYGIIGLFSGIILGASLALGAWLVLFKLSHLYVKWHPIRPICKNGKCSFRNYKLLEWKDRVVFQCRCGTKYLKKGRRFMEILDDGSTKPYMKIHGFFGKWKEDI
jgi:hypothetical protein